MLESKVWDWVLLAHPLRNQLSQTCFHLAFTATKASFGPTGAFSPSFLGINTMNSSTANLDFPSSRSPLPFLPLHPTFSLSLKNQLPVCFSIDPFGGRFLMLICKTGAKSSSRNKGALRAQLWPLALDFQPTPAPFYFEKRETVLLVIKLSHVQRKEKRRDKRG